ncbi:MAG: rRNA maturation RNase YbeY [Bacteroidaceae bacterium]|nr:rRNA maturation RNase YbeY [Bacteroidaceae bacterium]
MITFNNLYASSPSPVGEGRGGVSTASPSTTPCPEDWSGAVSSSLVGEGRGEVSGGVLPSWITQVASTYGRRVGDINYIFMDDESLLQVNRAFLGHDYYTDIITFDYDEADIIAGDLYISLDTVRSNAEMLGQPYERELYRVIIHGVLHLCGINDKGPGEREIMEAAEERALALLDDFLK